jgi:nucleotide-binding universal stress UspA family protein
MNIIVAVDFSDSSALVLAEAQKWAQLTAAHIWLVHIEEPYSDLVGEGSEFVGPVSSFGVVLNDPKIIPNNPEIKTFRNAEAIRLRERHARLQREAKEIRKQGLNVTALQLSGPMVETILQEAAKLPADLIIVGSHGHGMMRNLLLGSISEGILRHSQCPVLVVPTHKR